MRASSASAAAQSIPVYQLYGKESEGLPPERMHCESIAQRSRLYNWVIAPHRHEAFFQILHIEHGSGEALLEARRERISAPCLVVVPAMSVHGFRFTRNVRGLVITMTEAHLERISGITSALRRFLSVPRQFALRAGNADAELVALLFDRVGREFAGNAPWRMELISASLALALMTVVRDASSGLGPSLCIADRKTLHLQKFRNLVDENFRGNRQIDFYASKLGITTTQLNRICRELCGRSALGVINERVTLEAERDLIYTVLEVKNVALSLGFADAAYFSRFFAKHTGRTPTEFRRAMHAQLMGARVQTAAIGRGNRLLPPG